MFAMLTSVNTRLHFCWLASSNAKRLSLDSQLDNALVFGLRTEILFLDRDVTKEKT
jgi:hypothetical protein